MLFLLPEDGKKLEAIARPKDSLYVRTRIVSESFGRMHEEGKEGRGGVATVEVEAIAIATNEANGLERPRRARMKEKAKRSFFGERHENCVRLPEQERERERESGECLPTDRGKERVHAKEVKEGGKTEKQAKELVVETRTA